jgi:hypothetical protein
MSTWKEPDNLKYGDDNQGENTRWISHSGQVIGVSDKKGSEFLQLTHRTGTKVEMHPNGDVIIKSLKDHYQITLGDNKILISGNHDVTIQGGASLKVEGDYEMRVSGNMLSVIEGNMETTVHGNHNTAVKGDQEIAINGNQNTKVLGGIEHSADGKSYYAADGGLGIGSSSGRVAIDAATQILTESGSDTIMSMGSTFQTTSSGATTVIGERIDLNP